MYMSCETVKFNEGIQMFEAADTKRDITALGATEGMAIGLLRAFQREHDAQRSAGGVHVRVTFENADAE